MMDYIAGLIARGLISPDALQGLVQKVNNVRNFPGGQPPIEGGGGRGFPMGGASGKPTVAPDYGAQPPVIKKYNDALVYGKITPAEHEGFMDALGVDKAVGSRMRDSALKERDELLQSVREQLGGMREQGALIGPEERAQKARSSFQIVPDRDQ